MEIHLSFSWHIAIPIVITLIWVARAIVVLAREEDELKDILKAAPIAIWFIWSQYWAILYLIELASK